MDTRAPKVLYGRAIDTDNTKQCHQVFTVDYDKDRFLNTLYYSICAPSHASMPTQELVEKTKEVVHDPKTWKTPKGVQAAKELFSQLTQDIVHSTPHDGCFKFGEEKDAITCAIQFTESFLPTKFDIIQSKVILNEQMTHTQANNVLNADPLKDMDLFVSREVLSRYRQYFTNDKPRDPSMASSSMTQYAGHAMQTQIRSFNYKNDVPCVYQFKQMNHNAPTYSHWGDISNLKTDAYEIGFHIEDTFVPATCASHVLDRVNTGALKVYLQEGAKILDNDTLGIITHYKKCHHQFKLNRR